MNRRLVVALALGLGALAPGASAQQQTDLKYYYEDIFTPFFALDRGGKEFHPQRSGSYPSSFPARKAPGTFRVFVIGGSIAGRYMSASAGPHLGYALEQVLPSRKVEVMNCGMASYDSYREALVLEEVLDYSPDLIVLMTGHNEQVGSPPIPLWLLHTQDRLKEWGAYRALVEKIHDRLGTVNSTEESVAARNAAFKSNLQEMIRHAKARGVPVAVTLPPLNYRDAFPTFLPPMEDPRFLKGLVEYVRGDVEASTRAWSALLAHSRQQESASILLFLGRAAERAGRPQEAYDYYKRALQADSRFGGRCAQDCQQTIRSVAAEEGAILVDLDGAFREADAPRPPGLDMFEDAMHWHRGWNSTASRAFLDTFRSDPRLRDLPWDDKRLARLEDRWSGDTAPKVEDADTLNTVRYAAHDMERGDTALLSWRGVFYLETVLERRPEWFKDLDALSRRAQAGSNDQGKAWGMPLLNISPGRLHWHIGEARLMRGDVQGALLDFEAALKLDPSQKRARLGLAMAQSVSGHPKEAALSLQAAARDGLQAEAAALERALKRS